MLAHLVRENVKKMSAYSSARSEFEGVSNVLLDANENNFGSAAGNSYNRYPDPMQHQLKRKIAALNQTTEDHLFLGNGSDEAIDLLIRVFCVPGKDNVMYFDPTFNMYEVAAHLNDVGIKNIPLLPETFTINTPAALEAIDENTKIIFFCTPNNPTGNHIPWEDIKPVIDSFKGIIVFDEAYYDFVAPNDRYPDFADKANIIILKTFSKSWGMAGLRLGVVFAHPEVIGYLNKIKHPYNINEATQELALKALDKADTVAQWIKDIIKERTRVSEALAQESAVVKVYPSATNFILVKFEDGNKMYRHLLDKGIVTRNRSNVPMLENSIRITIGTPQENDQLIEAVKEYATVEA